MSNEEIKRLEEMKETIDTFIKMLIRIMDKYYLENEYMFNKFGDAWINLSRSNLAIEEILEQEEKYDNANRSC